MVNKVKHKYEIGSTYSINNKIWRLAEVTKKGLYVLQHENVGGTYSTMKFNESEMDNIAKTQHIYGSN